MEVHLDDLQAMFNYRDLDLIFKVMTAILIVVEMVSAQYISRNNWPSLTQFCMEVHLVEAKFNYHDLDIHVIFKVIVANLIVMEMVSDQYISRNNWPSPTQFGMDVHLDDLQVKFDYCYLDLILKFMAAILIVVKMVSAENLEK